MLGQSSTGGGLGAGKIAGIVVGVALAVGALIGIGIWLWFRRRHKKLREEHTPETAFVPRTGDTTPSNNVPSRQVSQMSTAGLLGPKNPRINTALPVLRQNTRSPGSTNLSPSNRHSAGTDQRLNPYALYMNEQAHASDVSLQDNHDYSRQLRVSLVETAGIL